MTNMIFVYGSRIRWLWLLMAVLGIANVGLAAYQVYAGSSHSALYDWLNLAWALAMATYFSSWVALNRHPIVRVTDTEIQLRVMGSRKPKRIPIREVVGLRWQDSYDLRLQTRSGTEHSIHLPMARERERARVAGAIAERTGVPGPTVWEEEPRAQDHHVPGLR